jgi:hypothetical protein
VNVETGSTACWTAASDNRSSYFEKGKVMRRMRFTRELSRAISEPTGVLFCVVLSGLLCLSALNGCGEGGGDVVPPSPDSGFNGRFGGQVSMDRGGQSSSDVLAFTLDSGSPLWGTVNTGTGGTGIISGETEGDTATFTGDIEPEDSGCLWSFSGGMILNGDGSISITMEGTDCTGAVSASGQVPRLQTDRLNVPNLLGVWQLNRNLTHPDIFMGCHIYTKVDDVEMAYLRIHSSTMEAYVKELSGDECTSTGTYTIVGSNRIEVHGDREFEGMVNLRNNGDRLAFVIMTGVEEVYDRI